MTTGKRTVVITGASSGMGFALAEAYLEQGYNVVGNARTIERLRAAAEKLGNPENFLLVEGDIALPETSKNIFEKAIAKFKRVDILVNNAGIFVAKPITSYTTEDLDSLINTNLKGFFYPTQAAAAHMIENKDGHIVNITAALGMQPNSAVPATVPVMVKGGLNQVTKSLAVELAKHNIKVNAVAPGVIATPLHSPDKHAFLSTLNPLVRVGDVDQIVDAVVYLTGSNFNTGAIIPVDGGAAAGR